MATRIRGAALINTLAILREVLGAPRFTAIVSGCPVKTQQLLRRTLVASEWVPLDVWAPFLQAIFEQTCHGDEHQFRRLLRAVCKRDFSTIYRHHLHQATPQTVLERVSAIWSDYYDTGSLTSETFPAEPGYTQVKVQMRGLETPYPLFAVTMQAYLEQLLVMAGASRCTIQRAGDHHADGKLSCDYIVSLLLD